HAYITSLEPAEIVMIGTVGNGVWWQMSETRRDVRKVGYPDRDNHAERCDRLAVIQLQEETVIGRLVQCNHLLVFEIRDEPLLKGEPIVCESVERNRKVDGLVWEAVFCAEVLQGKPAIRIMYVRRESI